MMRPVAEEQPKVSIVLPVWNRQRFVGEAIQSIVRQTFRSFELLVIDDGSTDGTAAVVASLAKLDSRIHLERCPHLGIVAALNEGIRRSRGGYVARMDSDDIAHPDRLERQVGYLESHPKCVLVGCDAEVIDEEGESLGVIWQPRRHADILQVLMQGNGTPFVHPTVMMRRGALRDAGSYRSESYPSEDLDLWLRLLEHGTLANIPERLLVYRRHSDTVCARERHKQVANTIIVCNRARVSRGLPELKPRKVPRIFSALAVYHNECARLALRAGRRTRALRHAGASIADAPLWAEPYASLVASLLPTRMLRAIVEYRYQVRVKHPRIIESFSSRG